MKAAKQTSIVYGKYISDVNCIFVGRIGSQVVSKILSVL